MAQYRLNKEELTDVLDSLKFGDIYELKIFRTFSLLSHLTPGDFDKNVVEIFQSAEEVYLAVAKKLEILVKKYLNPSFVDTTKYVKRGVDTISVDTSKIDKYDEKNDQEKKKALLEIMRNEIQKFDTHYTESLYLKKHFENVEKYLATTLTVSEIIGVLLGAVNEDLANRFNNPLEYRFEYERYFFFIADKGKVKELEYENFKEFIKKLKERESAKQYGIEKYHKKMEEIFNKILDNFYVIYDFPNFKPDSFTKAWNENRDYFKGKTLIFFAADQLLSWAASLTPKLTPITPIDQLWKRLTRNTPGIYAINISVNGKRQTPFMSNEYVALQPMGSQLSANPSIYLDQVENEIDVDINYKGIQLGGKANFENKPGDFKIGIGSSVLFLSGRKITTIIALTKTPADFSVPTDESVKKKDDGEKEGEKDDESGGGEGGGGTEIGGGGGGGGGGNGQAGTGTGTSAEAIYKKFLEFSNQAADELIITQRGQTVKYSSMIETDLSSIVDEESFEDVADIGVPVETTLTDDEADTIFVLKSEEWSDF